MVGYYVSVDFFVFFSLSEIFGNVIFEVLVLGLVVIVFDVVVVVDYIVYGDNGMVVVFGDE